MNVLEIAVITIVVLGAAFLRRVKPGQLGRLYSMGRFVRIVEPGFIFVLPVFQLLTIENTESGASDSTQNSRVMPSSSESSGITQDAQPTESPVDTKRNELFSGGGLRSVLFISLILGGIGYLLYLVI